MSLIVPIGYVRIHQALDYVGERLFGTEWPADEVESLPLNHELSTELENGIVVLQRILASGELQATALAEDGQEYSVPIAIWKDGPNGRKAICSGFLPLDLIDKLALKPPEWKRRHILIREADLKKALKKSSLTADRLRATRQKAGAKPKYDWPAFIAEAKRILEREGLPDAGDPSFSSKSKLVSLMAEWCSTKWSAIPADSTLKKYVDQAIAEFKKERASQY